MARWSAFDTIADEMVGRVAGLVSEVSHVEPLSAGLPPWWPKGIPVECLPTSEKTAMAACDAQDPPACLVAGSMECRTNPDTGRVAIGGVCGKCPPPLVGGTGGEIGKRWA